MAQKAKRTKRKELGFACYMLMEDGSTVPFDELTEEQREKFRENAAKRLSENMSAYYAAHLDEYARLCESLDRRDQ